MRSYRSPQLIGAGESGSAMRQFRRRFSSVSSPTVPMLLFGAIGRSLIAPIGTSVFVGGAHDRPLLSQREGPSVRLLRCAHPRDDGR